MDRIAEEARAAWSGNVVVREQMVLSAD
jgi:hypothetical protein